MNITQNHGRQGFAAYLRRRWQLYAMLLIPAFVVLLFNYVPLPLALAIIRSKALKHIVHIPARGFQQFIPASGLE